MVFYGCYVVNCRLSIIFFTVKHLTEKLPLLFFDTKENFLRESYNSFSILVEVSRKIVKQSFKQFFLNNFPNFPRLFVIFSEITPYPF